MLIRVGPGSLAVLPYETVRTSRDPSTTLLAFCHSAYEAAARLAGWDATSSPRPGVLPLASSASSRPARPLT